MLLKCGVREDFLRVPWTARRVNQSILKEISPEYSLERLMLKLKFQYFGHLMWRPWCWESLTEDEMVGWHHRLNRHEFEQVLGDGEGQGSLVCCSPWGLKEADTTEGLNCDSHGLPRNVDNNLLFSILPLDGDLESIMAWLSLSQVFFIWICFTKGSECT